MKSFKNYIVKAWGIKIDSEKYVEFLFKVHNHPQKQGWA